MRYCTLSDLALAIPAQSLRWLSNDDPKALEPDQTVLEAAVTDAEEQIDAALRGRYSLPLPEVPSVVKSITVNLARHWLYLRRPEGRELPDGVVRAYKASLDMLTQLRNGGLHLGLPTGQAVAEPGAVRVHAPARRFGADVLDRY